MCTLAEHQDLRYVVTRRGGRRGTETLVQPGPTGVITTSTRALRPPLSTHLLCVPVAADGATTRPSARGRRGFRVCSTVSPHAVTTARP